jgi:hypothetical protein
LSHWKVTIDEGIEQGIREALAVCFSKRMDGGNTETWTVDIGGSDRLVKSGDGIMEQGRVLFGEKK